MPLATQRSPSQRSPRIRMPMAVYGPLQEPRTLGTSERGGRGCR
eukprot:CAMPEP_0176334412 /NCGR_PEP_ID=MMETSP0121_2-20121125/78092_1 /TAXON_ID=160619 /ORGANISM="Kryptoperidinium foliaceum, Strain CCMP 1326" /LENGTH=43 /DNA_ID= /DNA_START= /DNA_END= /DNA_ORIENTATION=